jgi:hypothetical protein
MAVALIGNVGIAEPKSTSTTVVVTVGAGGVAVGTFLLARATSSASSGGLMSIADSKTNTWTVNTSGLSWNPELLVAYTIVTNALVNGDTITVTTTSSGARAMSVDAFSGVSTTVNNDPSVASGNNLSAPDSGAFTPGSVGALVIGVANANGPKGDTFIEDTDATDGDTWHSLTRAGTVGGSQTTNVTTNAAYKINANMNTSFGYQPTFTPLRAWSAKALVLQAATAAPKVLPPDMADRRIRRNSLLRR